jgi:Tfp pilus assembly protein PilX
VSDGRSTISGPRGFALVLGGMLLVMAALWGLAALVAP